MIETEEENDRHEDIEGSDLSNIIINILDYYSFKQRVEDEGDTWKKDTKYEAQELIPKDLDAKVKELFLETLGNLIDIEKKKKKKK